MRVIDLNADLGEGVGDDEALLEVVTSANIATGAHAGGGTLLQRAVEVAVRSGVAVGAHPSYRDRAGFGRASRLAVLRADPGARAALTHDLIDQILTVARVAERAGAALTHVKAHGSIYNEAVHDPLAAGVVLEAVQAVSDRLGYRVAVMSLPDGHLARSAAAAGIAVIAEGFVDRGYARSGQLVARGRPGDLHESIEVMVGQALALAAGTVRCVEGPMIEVSVGSLCVHGDTPGAVAAARSVHTALLGAGWQVRSPLGSVTRTRPPPGQWPAGDPIARPATEGEALTVVGAEPRIRAVPFGDRAVLIEPLEWSAPRTAWVLRTAGRARARWPGAEVIAGLASVLVVFDRPADRPAPAQVSAKVSGAGDGGGAVGAGPGRIGARRHSIDVRYDGTDLGDLARTVGVGAHELVARHAAATWTVAAVGFSPGFGYLTCPDPLFGSIPRRDDPRSRVPAGSLALAAGMCAIYPSASPGGWQLVGRTQVVLFDPHADQPALLAIGDTVRFRVDDR